jgi:hypothetical protein
MRGKSLAMSAPKASIMSRHTERLDAAYHGAKNSTSIRGALLIESSNVAEVSFTTSEGDSNTSPSATT